MFLQMQNCKRYLSKKYQDILYWILYSLHSIYDKNIPPDILLDGMEDILEK
jgi:hypothetical protein